MKKDMRNEERTMKKIEKETANGKERKCQMKTEEGSKMRNKGEWEKQKFIGGKKKRPNVKGISKRVKMRKEEETKCERNQ